MSFKDIVTADIRAVLVNPDEFADLHEINGKQMTAVVDESEYAKTPLTYADGVFVVRKTLYVAFAELGSMPEEDSWMTLDGLRMRVAGAADEFGMLVIQLEANNT